MIRKSVEQSQASQLAMPRMCSAALLFPRRLSESRRESRALVCSYGLSRKAATFAATADVVPYVFTSIDDPRLDEVMRRNR